MSAPVKCAPGEVWLSRSSPAQVRASQVALGMVRASQGPGGRQVRLPVSVRAKQKRKVRLTDDQVRADQWRLSSGRRWDSDERRRFSPKTRDARPDFPSGRAPCCAPQRYLSRAVTAGTAPAHEQTNYSQI